jgi:hypothetical protein
VMTEGLRSGSFLALVRMSLYPSLIRSMADMAQLGHPGSIVAGHSHRKYHAHALYSLDLSEGVRTQHMDVWAPHLDKVDAKVGNVLSVA